MESFPAFLLFEGSSSSLQGVKHVRSDRVVAPDLQISSKPGRGFEIEVS